jgi:hypothetical protein
MLPDALKRPVAAGLLPLALLQFASPALAQSEYQLQPPERRYPLSAQILQINLAPFQVTRGGFEVPDLLLAVAGSPRAQELIQTGQSQASTGTILGVTSIVAFLGSLIISVAIAASAGPHPTDSQATAVGVTLGVGLVVGLVAGIAGGVLQASGLHNIAQGINSYNADLLDGRLQPPVPPAAMAVPPR